MRNRLLSSRGPSYRSLHNILHHIVSGQHGSRALILLSHQLYLLQEFSINLLVLGNKG